MLEQLVRAAHRPAAGRAPSAPAAPIPGLRGRPRGLRAFQPARRSQDPRPADPGPLEALRGARPQVLSNAAYVDAVMRRPCRARRLDRRPRREQRYLGAPGDSPRRSRRPSTPSRFTSSIAGSSGTSSVARWTAPVISYLRLPATPPRHRPGGSRDVANLGEDFSGRTPFSPVGDDREVVEASLHLLLGTRAARTRSSACWRRRT